MNRQPKNIVRLLLSAGIATGIIVMLSVPLISPLPPLGNVLNPIGGVWGVKHGYQSVETYSGLPGMLGNVTVVRDSYGIPHVYAKYERDAAFVMGYMQARDRLVQLELTLRQISGTTSQIEGVSRLSKDEFFRTLRLQAMADNVSNYVQQNYPAIFAVLQSYCNGINYYINNTPAAELPLEFHLLGISPTRWTPANVFGLQKYMEYDLTFYWDDLYRSYMNETYGSQYPNIIRDLYPINQPFQIPVVPTYGSYPDIHPAGSAGSEQQAISDAMSFVTSATSDQDDILRKNAFDGSNNWAISGAKSSTGYPMLCNDMHLSWYLPSLWYEAQIVAQDTNLDVTGFTLVGAPLVIVGHNQHIAWGITNTAQDEIDWYYYKGNGTHYLYNGTYYPYTSVTEQIPVKGEGTVPFTINFTRDGPLITNPCTDMPVAFKWGSLVNNSRIFLALYGFDHAQNFTAFNSSLANWDLPSQNVLYADTSGNIAIRCQGLIPLRYGVTAAQIPDSSVPIAFVQNGSQGLHGWCGFISPDKLPSATNPSQGYLESSNQVSAGPSYPYFTQKDEDAGYRAQRINDLLSTETHISVAGMEAIQLDDYDCLAAWFVPMVLSVYNNASYFGASDKTGTLGDAMQALQAWSSGSARYQMDKSLAAPAIFSAIFEKFKNNTWLNRLDQNFANGIMVPFPNDNVLENISINASKSIWFHSKINAGITCRDDVINESIHQGIAYLESLPVYSGKAPGAWLYGDIHQDLFPATTGLDALSAGPYPANGSEYTVSATESGYIAVSNAGSSERMVVDLSNMSNSVDVVPGGSSGDAASPHYTDQLALFLNGQYHPMWYFATASVFPGNDVESTLTFKGGA